MTTMIHDTSAPNLSRRVKLCISGLKCCVTIVNRASALRASSSRMMEASTVTPAYSTSPT